MKILVNNNWEDFDSQLFTIAHYKKRTIYRYNNIVINKKTKFEITCIRCGKIKTVLLRSFDPKINKEICRECNVKNVNIDKCGMTCNLHSKEGIEQKKKTWKKNYGVENPFQAKAIKEKIVQTNLKKYGVAHPSQNKEIYEKMKKTNLKKYGNEFAVKNKLIKEKLERINLKRHGVKYPFQSIKIQNKIKESNFKTYGHENQFCRKEVIEIISQKNISNQYNKFLSTSRFNNIIPLFTIEEYKGGNYTYKWQCQKCGNIFEDNLYQGRIPRCLNCFPLRGNISLLEKEIVDWLKSFNINIVENSKQIIPPLELDIYLPDYNLGIEFNGLFWHSELQGKNRNYHLNKTIECEKKGIQLIHIFEDEWIEKQEIVKSIIKSKLGIYDKTIHARKCVVKKIENLDDFYEHNHIQGNIQTCINYGLFLENDLVSAMSFKHKKNTWELVRFVNKINTKIHGSFSKLLSFFQKENSGPIITYADRRIFNGDVYIKNGFKKTDIINPRYFYTDYKNRFYRRGFQKQFLKTKLKIYDSQLTEWENMQLNHWDRIWNCGYIIYKFL